MSTVGALVDQVYRDWLAGGTDQPVRGVLDTTVTSAATTILVDLAGLAADEQDAFASGAVVELERELIYVTAVDVAGDVATLTVGRAANGTAAAAHTAGSYVFPAPTYARQTVFDAVCDEIPALWPDLYRTATEQLVIGADYTEVPDDVETVVSLHWFDTVWQALVPELVKDFPPSTTGRALLAPVAPSGRTAYLTYRAGFARPSSETTSLVTLGVERGWERIVAAGAVASIISGNSELDVLTSEFIAEQLARESTPTGSAGQLATRLLRLRTDWISRAQRQLKARDRHPVSFMPLAGV